MIKNSEITFWNFPLSSIKDIDFYSLSNIVLKKIVYTYKKYTHTKTNIFIYI